jgi:ABC-type transport system involved in multi-copper enzyme maturation permease subunit
MVDISSIATVVKKEVSDNVRNKWIIVLTAIFAILTLAASVLAGGGSLGGLEETVTSLMSISMILIPLIAIMLGYATISGEDEDGSLAVLLSYPIRRGEVFIGKFFGLAIVIALATSVGFGISGVAIGLSKSATPWGNYAAFILLAVLLGVLYLSVSMCFSALFKRRVASLGAGILLFFWSTIYGTVLMGIYFATGGSMSDFTSMNPSIPDWFWNSIYLSPMDMNQTATMLVFNIERAFGFAIDVPSFINLARILGAHLAWIAIPLVIAYVAFERRDI